MEVLAVEQKRTNVGTKVRRRRVWSEQGEADKKTVRATRAKEVRLEKPAEKHPSPGHTHVGFGKTSLHKEVGYEHGVLTHRIVAISRQLCWRKLAFTIASDKWLPRFKNCSRPDQYPPLGRDRARILSRFGKSRNGWTNHPQRFNDHSDVN